MARQIFGPLLNDAFAVAAIVTLLGVGIAAYVATFLYGDWEDD
jgi:hypothetical protein